MKKKEILIVNTDLDIGGGELSLVAFLNHTDPEKYNITLALLQNKTGLLPRIKREIKILPLWEMKKWEKLPGRYDVAIGYKQGKSTAFVAGRVNADIKIGRYAHGNIKYTGIRKFIYKYQYSKMNYVIASNKFMADMLTEFFRFPSGKVRVIPNIYNTEEIISKSEEYTVPRDTKLVFSTLARICRVKRIDLVPEIAKKLTEAGITDFKWYVVGKICDDSYNKSIFEKVKSYGLEEKIIFTDTLANPYPYLKASDIYIHISDAEGYSRSVIEALALRVGVLSTETIGGKAQIQDGRNGFLAKTGDIDDISEKLVYMIKNIDEIKKNQPVFTQDNQKIMQEFYKIIN